MPDVAIDYHGIRLGIHAAIRAQEGLETVTILDEHAVLPAPEMLPAIIIFLDEVKTPAKEQKLAAGMTTDHRLVFSLIVMHYSLASMAEAVRLRDEIRAKLDLALMRDRTLGGNLSRGLFLEAGEIGRLQDSESSAFAAVAEVRLVCDAQTRV